MDKPRSFAPIIAAVLLLLPVLYVGSYLALVVPSGIEYSILVHRTRNGKEINYYPPRITRYRLGRDRAATFFWPLEQIDRRLRPGAWEIPLEKFGGGTGLLKPRQTSH